MYLIIQTEHFFSRWVKIFNVIKATSPGTLVVIISAIVFSIHMFFIPVFVAVFWFGSSAIAISNRLMLTYTLE